MNFALSLSLILVTSSVSPVFSRHKLSSNQFLPRDYQLVKDGNEHVADNYMGNSYKFYYPDARTREDARAVCRNDGGDLAVLPVKKLDHDDSSEEHDSIEYSSEERSQQSEFFIAALAEISRKQGNPGGGMQKAWLGNKFNTSFGPKCVSIVFGGRKLGLKTEKCDSSLAFVCTRPGTTQYSNANGTAAAR